MSGENRPASVQILTLPPISRLRVIALCASWICGILTLGIGANFAEILQPATGLLLGFQVFSILGSALSTLLLPVLLATGYARKRASKSNIIVELLVLVVLCVIWVTNSALIAVLNTGLIPGAYWCKISICYQAAVIDGLCFLNWIIPLIPIAILACALVELSHVDSAPPAGGIAQIYQGVNVEMQSNGAPVPPIWQQIQPTQAAITPTVQATLAKYDA